MPAYNSNVPQANQTVASTQLPIQTNFASIQQTLVVNHEDFNSPNFGKHKFVELPNQPSDPAAATAEMTIYSKQYNNGVTTQSEAFIKRDDAGVPVPFTAALKASPGWSYLPSGILMQWGVDVGPFTGFSGLINFPKAFTTQVFSVVICPTGFNNPPTDSNFAVRINEIALTNFTVFVSSRTTTGPGTGRFNYVAIGI